MDDEILFFVWEIMTKHLVLSAVSKVFGGKCVIVSTQWKVPEGILIFDITIEKY